MDYEEDEILAPVPIYAWKPHDADTTQLPATVVPKQFWKAGDYEECLAGRSGEGDTTLLDGMDYVRVYPRFLHSNATSHKWVLGALHIDMLVNKKKDGSRMLLVEDNGGGMSPATMRQCMSLGYSAKSKLEDTIGQYGNGFKTNTMRVGADVIVFSRCLGKDGGSPTQSIGLLSYTFLTRTGKEDIVVPMLDYEKKKRNTGPRLCKNHRLWLIGIRSQHGNGHMNNEGTRASVQIGKDSEVNQNLASKRNEQVASKTCGNNLITENGEQNYRNEAYKRSIIK
ncbi:hypothetical protein MKW94_018298 [Papaver nudicaule]|uniref:Uncharacterized protein n=1 Tax=Papaver nudicaule TaxID=74823 RepID=A0AA41W159_PAPNU|nr:hypothetical protein [Papaver nudicaule]